MILPRLERTKLRSFAMTNALNILIFIQMLPPLSDWEYAGPFKRLNGTGRIKRWQVYVADGATGNNKNQLANK